VGINITSSITFEWRPPDGGDIIDRYFVYWREAEMPWQLSPSIPHIAAAREIYNFSLADLNPGSKYSVEIYAENSAGFGSKAIITAATGKIYKLMRLK